MKNMLLIVVAFLAFNFGSVEAVTITVGNATGSGQVEVLINLSHNLGSIATVFTLNYDAASVVLVGIESEVFDMILTNDLPSGTMIAAGCDGSDSDVLKILTGQVPSMYEIEDVNGDSVIGIQELEFCSGGLTLFNLTFQLNPGAPLGTYPVEIVRTTLSDSGAGYDSSGEEIPILIGRDFQYPPEDPWAFPVIINPPIIGTVEGGSVEFVERIFGDVNGDGFVLLNDVKRAFEGFLGAQLTEEELAAADVCGDDGNILLEDVKGVFEIFLGGSPTCN